MPAPRTRVQVGIDAAITANHSVAVRRPGAGSAATRFSVPPTLAGLQTLTHRLAEFPNVMAVAEPTSMTWLQLAALYQRLMVERGHCHTSATVAVARKLAERTWTVLSRGKPYQLRDLDGQPITERGARRLVADQLAVGDEVRKRARAHSAATHRSKLTR